MWQPIKKNKQVNLKSKPKMRFDISSKKKGRKHMNHKCAKVNRLNGLAENQSKNTGVMT